EVFSPVPIKSSLCLCLLLAALASSAAAQEEPYTPERGDPVRQAVVDALRAPVQKELKKNVVFKINHLKVKGGWAFLRGVPQQPGGQPMDYQGTPYQQAIEDGVFDNEVCALLRKQGSKWRVVTYSLGATDVVYEGWDKEYKAPSAIFK
ncbi:MAG: hypothetical protein ACRD68_16800, partial [Pyrinomonadaceae bacterium]